ncbi:hypothetical protein IMSHALPRED_009286 [Imshaugia aleurites]|uniref:Uncharacterized protein n=1 Tax=Imshaugia aleurites TaxID=172621 RepID=A0A8H3IA29_9LECA|nr:hypothetical protein IMSHALPRED_009286 [Imshaugia aleurites]
MKPRCFHCGHTKAHNETQFRSNPTYKTPRESLVNDAIQRLLKHRFIVIRAPPLSGKTTLLDFMGAKILKDHPEIEPVKIRWPIPSKERTENKAYSDILEEGYGQAIEANRTGLDINEKRTPVYLIDDAHYYSYFDTDFWDDKLKRLQSKDPYFVLVCEHGSADMLFTGGDGP